MNSFDNEENSFYNVIQKANSESWCMKLYCTTCGALRFREELYKIGLESILDQMMLLTDSEIDYILSVQGNPMGILEWEMLRQPQLWSRLSVNPPKVYLYWKRRTDEILQQKLERKKKNLQIQEEIKRIASERRESRKKYKNQQNKQSGIARDQIIKKFNMISFEEKVRTIAEDYEHLPNYYPCEIERMTIDEIDLLSLETLEKLIARLAPLNARRWMKLRARVNEAIYTRRSASVP